jgi:hypothetical protein
MARVVGRLCQTQTIGRRPPRPPSNIDFTRTTSLGSRTTENAEMKGTKMKKYLSCALAVFVATTVVAIASPEADIQPKEKAAWQAFKDKKADDFKNLVDKDFRGVYSDGISCLQKELDDMKKWDMKSFAISDFTAFSDEPDVIVTTYVVKIEGTYDGKDATGTYNAGSVWKKEKDAWLAIFHTNAKQEKAAK